MVGQDFGGIGPQIRDHGLRIGLPTAARKTAEGGLAQAEGIGQGAVAIALPTQVFESTQDQYAQVGAAEGTDGLACPPRLLTFSPATVSAKPRVVTSPSSSQRSGVSPSRSVGSLWVL